MAKKKFNLKDPATMQVLFAAGIILLAGYLWYEQMYVPLHENIEILSNQKSGLESELLKINAIKPQLDKLRKEAIVLEAKLDSLKNIFPDRKDMTRLIRDITAVNRRSNVVTTRFTPKPDVEREYYVENKYDMTVLGDFHNLGALFSHMANFQLIVNLSGVSITANPSFVAGGGSGGAAGQLAIEKQPSVFTNFELTTFSSRR